MNGLFIAAGLVCAFLFLFLRPRYKVLIAFFFMTLGFNVIPRYVFNLEVWDPGAVLLLIAGVQLLFMKTAAEPIKTGYLSILKLFIVWLTFCLLWSLLIYQYPLLDTLKVSRQIIIGYMSVFIFIRLFRVDPKSFDFFLKFFYWTTFVLMLFCIAQHQLNLDILFIRETEYGNTIRLIPTFFPICLFFLWVLLSKIFSHEKMQWHELVYIFITFLVTAITYTRGIYISVAAVFLLMLMILLYYRKIGFSQTFLFFTCAVSLILVLTITGAMDRVLSRAYSGIELVTGLDKNHQKKAKDNYDTFTGRILTAKERFDMVAHKNPVVGFGFIHEDNIPRNLRKNLNYGSVITTPKYLETYRYTTNYVLALYTADIGWPNIVLQTGFIGFFIFILFIICFLWNWLRNRRLGGNEFLCIRLGVFLQMVTFVLLMFNGTPLSYLVQIPSFFIAGYAFLTHQAQESQNKANPENISGELDYVC